MQLFALNIMQLFFALYKRYNPDESLKRNKKCYFSNFYLIALYYTRILDIV